MDLVEYAVWKIKMIVSAVACLYRVEIIFVPHRPGFIGETSVRAGSLFLGFELILNT
jgi:hypothetical protein